MNDNEEINYNELSKLGYGEQLVTDENGEVIDVCCNHYYNHRGACVFCDAIKHDSPLYYELYGGE